MTDEINDIQNQEPIDEEGLETWDKMPHPQDDVPTEVIVHYIVKDYQRMVKAVEYYKSRAELTEKQIELRAKAIAAPRKKETNELADLRLELDAKTRKIHEMYDWLFQKDHRIRALTDYIESRRKETHSLQMNVNAQRQQIRSLLGQFDDKYSALEGCHEAWNSEKWRESIIKVSDIDKQIAELKSVVTTLDVREEDRATLTESLRIIRCDVRRAYHLVSCIAIPALRDELISELRKDDADSED